MLSQVLPGQQESGTLTPKGNQSVGPNTPQHLSYVNITRI